MQPGDARPVLVRRGQPDDGEALAELAAQMTPPPAPAAARNLTRKELRRRRRQPKPRPWGMCVFLPDNL